jgi:hypothetical protein
MLESIHPVDPFLGKRIRLPFEKVQHAVQIVASLGYFTPED